MSVFFFSRIYISISDVRKITIYRSTSSRHKAIMMMLVRVRVARLLDY